jgi:type II secretory pathway pseudopilin PulG
MVVDRPFSGLGFALIEVLIATVVLTGGALVVVALFAAATRSIQSANNMSKAAVLAGEKLDQLRALAWYYAADGSAQSDFTSDLSTDPPTDSGQGLAPSPAMSLGQSTAGYVDYLDRDGRWIGNGATPNGIAAFVRRWNIQAASADPLNTRVLRVVVFPAAASSAVAGDVPLGTGALIVGTVTRTAR